MAAMTNIFEQHTRMRAEQKCARQGAFRATGPPLVASEPLQ
jgi:hypothetical protein